MAARSSRHPATALLLLPLLLGGCSSAPPPRPVDEAALVRRGQSRIDGDVTVTVAPLDPAEARGLLGFDVAAAGIQPVWVKVVNRENRRWYLPPINLDSDYYSPLEVAWIGHRPFASQANLRLDALLDRLALPPLVEARTTRSGYVFTDLDEGMKFVNLELVAPAPRAAVRRFSFLAQVPGHATDFQTVNWNRLYPSPKWRDLDENGLRHWLERDVPCCASGGDRRTPADPINVVIVGNRDSVFPALARRGWHVTQTLSVESVWRTVQSALLGSSYRNAPVSPLYLFGRRQDLALQKARRDVHQRNHMRLWLAPVTYRGLSVWVGQISRDIGVRLTRRTITTHKIDPDVDETRWYLLQDLFYSDSLDRFGFVGGVGVSRPDQPRTNFTGDPYVTDGRRTIFWIRPPAITAAAVTPSWIPFRQRSAAGRALPEAEAPLPSPLPPPQPAKAAAAPAHPER